MHIDIITASNESFQQIVAKRLLNLTWQRLILWINRNIKDILIVLGLKLVHKFSIAYFKYLHWLRRSDNKWQSDLES